MSRYPAIGLAEATARLTAPGAPYRDRGARHQGHPDARLQERAGDDARRVPGGAQASATRPFLVYDDERASFEAFARASLAVAGELQRLGVRKGDRVAIAMRNLPEWPVAFFGAILVGAIATPLNAWGTGPELEYGLADCGAKVALRRSRAARAAVRASAQLPGARARLRQPRDRGGRASPGAQARGADRRDQRLEQAARPAAARGRAGARRRRDDLLYLRHDRQAEGRARHASQFLHDHPRARLRLRARCAAARRAARRRRSRTRRSARRCSRCRCFTPPAASRR